MFDDLSSKALHPPPHSLPPPSYLEHPLLPLSLYVGSLNERRRQPRLDRHTIV
jgi:hypothetical protein